LIPGTMCMSFAGWHTLCWSLSMSFASSTWPLGMRKALSDFCLVATNAFLALSLVVLTFMLHRCLQWRRVWIRQGLVLFFCCCCLLCFARQPGNWEGQYCLILNRNWIVSSALVLMLLLCYHPLFVRNWTAPVPVSWSVLFCLRILHGSAAQC
jgi:hypothetical protein